MSNSISIFNDVVEILDSIVGMETSLSDLAKTTEALSQNFKSGKLEDAQTDCDILMKNLQGVEEVFKTKTLQPAMDLYQKIKQLMSRVVLEGEDQLTLVEERSGIKEAREFLKKMGTHFNCP